MSKQLNLKYNVFLIGAMKCGTTSLYDYLAKNPEIALPPIKEPEFFSKNMDLNQYKNGEYLNLFKIDDTSKYTLDASTGYTKYPNEIGVPQRIFNTNLRPMFIYIVRNPYDRIESHFNFMKRDLKWKSKITSQHLIDVSNYHLQLKQYLKYFDKDKILILDFDELVKQPNKLLDKVYIFLEIKNKMVFESKIQSNKTKPANSNLLKFKQKIGSNVTKYLSKSLKKKVKQIFFKNDYVRLSQKQKTKIKQQLEKDMIQFGKDFNFDVSKWGFK